MSKIMSGVRLLTFDDFPEDIATALRRANVWQRFDDSTNILYITSIDEEQRLTNDEKIRISEYLIMKKILRTVFIIIL